MTGEQDVAGDDCFLRHRGPAGQAEDAGQLALVHLGALGEPRLLRVLGNDAVEGLDVLQRPAHQHRVGDAHAVVGEHPHRRSRVGHRAELGQPFTAQPYRHGTNGPYVAVAGLSTEPPDLLDDAGGVGDGIGIGHCVDGRESAKRRGGGSGRDRLGVLPTGLAQVSVQVDEAGEDDQAVSVDPLGAQSSQPAHIGDAAVPQVQIGCRPVGQRGSDDEVVGHRAPPSPESSVGRAPASSRYSTAIRTLTPFATCSTIVDRALSATSALISRPRFIGPGCMTMASSLSTPSRRPSRPYRLLYSRALGKKPPPDRFIRSRCTRNAITTSLFGSTSSRSYDVAHGQAATPTGSSVGGATRVTSAPSVASSSTLLRATLLCRTSPTMVTRRPSRLPRWARIVKASNSA